MATEDNNNSISDLFSKRRGDRVGTRFIQGLLKEEEKVVSTSKTPTTPKATPTPTPQVEQAPAPTPEQAIPQDSAAPIATPQLPTNEQPSSDVDRIRGMLAEMGYKDTPENIVNYAKNNLVSEDNSTVINTSDLSEIEDPTLVKSKKSFIKDSLKHTMPFQLLMGAKTGFEVIIEGLERYEAAKTAFIASGIKGQIPTGVAEGLAGVSKTKFPDAKRRGSDKPELGDLFRELGLPEGVAATLGLTADIVSDIPIFGGIGSTGKKLTKKGATAATEAQAKEAILGVKGDAFVKDMTDALMGKGIFDSLAPATKQTIRTSVGATQRESIDAEILVNALHKTMFNESIQKGKKVLDEDILANTLEALTKGEKSAQFQGLSKAQQASVKEARGMIDNMSNQIGEQLERTISLNPKKFTKQKAALAKQAGFSEEAASKLPIEGIIASIKSNNGTYARRYYQMYADKNFKPNPKAVEKAIKGLVEDEFAKNPEEAAKMLDNFSFTKSVSMFSRKKAAGVKVNADSLIARQNIPDYIREFMGEIKDPRYVIFQTVRDLAETRTNLKIINSLDELGSFSEVATKTHPFEIKAGPLSLGLVNGKFASSEVVDTIKHIIGSGDVQTETSKKIMGLFKGLKAAKTVGNPKTHSHNFLGNIPFSILAGNSILNPKNWKYYHEMFDIWRAAGKVRKGELPKDNPLFKKFQEMVENGVIGTELPSAEKLDILGDFVTNPYTTKKVSQVEKAAQGLAKAAVDAYTFEDVLFKGSTFLKNTKGKGMNAIDATEDLYKWYPNYFEAAKIAETARNSTAGVMFLTPFMTFRAEAHRIMLNGFKNGKKNQLLTSMMIGSKVAWNTSMLTLMGNNMNDIWSYYNSKPEAVSETLINPFSEKDFDLNVRYMDPFSSRGLFAPLMSLAGMTGTNPFDYLLDFTTLSPDFGYSNLLVNAIEPAVTGRGKFGQELSPTERVLGLTKGVGPTSFTTDLPKILNPKTEAVERQRRMLRFFGIDVEKRNPKWIKGQVNKAVRKAAEKGEDLTSFVNALDTMGFNGEKMVTAAVKKVDKKEKAKGEPSRNQRILKKGLGFLGI